MTGRTGQSTREVADKSRYIALLHLQSPDGEGLLRPEYDYITIWGFWNGPNELLAEKDAHHYYGINSKRAHAGKMIPNESLIELTQMKSRRLARCGFEDLNPKPDHLLISFDEAGRLVRDTFGKPEMRLCNFELIRPMG